MNFIIRRTDREGMVWLKGAGTDPKEVTPANPSGLWIEWARDSRMAREFCTMAALQEKSALKSLGIPVALRQVGR